MKKLIAILLAALFVFCGCAATPEHLIEPELSEFSLDQIPPFNGEAFCAVNGNAPCFTEAQINSLPFENYSTLDSLGRCGVALACIDKSLMPTEERGSIGSVKPTGWHTVKYDNVDGKYLYNRCHLIGFQLTGENANTQNLITGTRFMNVEGMLPFENMVADYIRETGNRVLYRVTPVYQGDNLLAHGVLMEAYSVEDQGAGICFNVFCYNAQPDISIDYATGESSYFKQDYSQAPETSLQEDLNDITYVINQSSKKFHYPNCGSVQDMKPENRKPTDKSRDELIAEGYSPCGSCNP